LGQVILNLPEDMVCRGAGQLNQPFGKSAGLNVYHTVGYTTVWYIASTGIKAQLHEGVESYVGDGSHRVEWG